MALTQLTASDFDLPLFLRTTVNLRARLLAAVAPDGAVMQRVLSLPPARRMPLAAGEAALRPPVFSPACAGLQDVLDTTRRRGQRYALARD